MQKYEPMKKDKNDSENYWKRYGAHPRLFIPQKYVILRQRKIRLFPHITDVMEP